MQTKIFVIRLQFVQSDTILKSEFTSFNKNANYCNHDQFDIELDNFKQTQVNVLATNKIHETRMLFNGQKFKTRH